MLYLITFVEESSPCVIARKMVDQLCQGSCGSELLKWGRQPLCSVKGSQRNGLGWVQA